MKRTFHLFEQLTSFENLLSAFYRARKGKRGKKNITRFEINLEKELKAGTYRPGTYRTFKIYEPKERMISAAPFRDRVVHHALCLVIEPVFEPTLIFDTYANRKGKGTHAGIHRCQKFCRKYKYVLKADIRKFFPSIDHQILKSLVARKIGCKKTLNLINCILDASNPQEYVDGYFLGDDLFSPLERRIGLPMGNLTSQFFANLYLSPLDHFVKENLGFKAYARYVDDFILFSDSKVELNAARKAVELFLGKELRLRLHPSKQQISLVKNGIDFLGQRITGRVRLLRKSNLRRFWRRTLQRIQGYFTKKITPLKLESQLNAWRGHLRQADAKGLEKQIFSQLLSLHVNICKAISGNWRIF
jgi:retron-type reverse transcriptase